MVWVKLTLLTTSSLIEGQELTQGWPINMVHPRGDWGWSRDRHLSQVRPMRISSGTFFDGISKERVFFLLRSLAGKNSKLEGLPWWRSGWVRLPMQGTQVRALVQEDPTCRGATKPVRHNYWACALEPTSDNYWSPRAATTEARTPRACALRQEKPPLWEARASQRRVAPAHHNQRKPACSNEDPI